MSRILAVAMVAAALVAVPAVAQEFSATGPDAGAALAQAAAAADKADQAMQAATAARSAATGAVRSVGGNAPDTTGNVSLPNAFTNATCAGCTMSAPAITGAATLNGTAIASVNDIAAEVTARNAAIASFAGTIVTSVNGQIGAVAVPLYTDAQAVAANASSIANATTIARAAAADVVQVVSPASGGTVATNASTTLLFINNSALLASLNVSFPTNPTDGQRFGVFANNTVTTLGFTGATSRGALNTISASGYARFVYSSSVGVWFRAG